MARRNGSTPKTDIVITGDEIQFHDNPTIIVPRSMTYARLLDIIQAKRIEQETVADFTRQYNYRIFDGAVATSTVMRDRYGMVIGKEIPGGFFSPDEPPIVLNVPIGPDGQTVQAPWGCIQIPVLEDAEVYLDDTRHEDFGTIFQITVRAKKKYAKEVEDFLAAVDEQLRKGSIYRGKAVAGADSLNFIEGLDTFNASQIVFAKDVEMSLEAALFGPICMPDAYRRESIPLKRALLFYGPYGTGKTSIGMMTAQVATRYGWTFIMARPGRDSVNDVLNTARLYAPAVVWVEDIDTETNTNDARTISAMLDAFDGITSKTGDIIVAMSTNHIEKVPPGMLRPGRLDYVLEIAELDRHAMERLVRIVVPKNKLADDVDFDIVCAEMTGFLPAFVRAAADRAKSFALHRTGGASNYLLTTGDLVNAARSLHPQLKLHQEALEVPATPTLDNVMRGLVTEGVTGMKAMSSSFPTLVMKPPSTLRRRS